MFRQPLFRRMLFRQHWLRLAWWRGAVQTAASTATRGPSWPRARGWLTNVGQYWVALPAVAVATAAFTTNMTPEPDDPSVDEASELDDTGNEPLESHEPEKPPLPSIPGPPRVHPWAQTPDAEIAQFVKSDPERLGSLSIGRPNRGALLNAVQLQEDPVWHVVEPDKAWGTRETVEILSASIRRIAQRYDDTPRLHVGHLSRESGGYLRPHRSHQSGRDVDLGFYYLDGEQWYTAAGAANLDRERTWALISDWLEAQVVEFIFIDRSIQRLLRDHAESLGIDEEFLDLVFKGHRGAKDSIIRHTWGHLTHMHVRFKSPVARESGWRAYPHLLKGRKIAPRVYYRRGTRDHETPYSPSLLASERH